MTNRTEIETICVQCGNREEVSIIDNISVSTRQRLDTYCAICERVTYQIVTKVKSDVEL